MPSNDRPAERWPRDTSIELFSLADHSVTHGLQFGPTCSNDGQVSISINHAHLEGRGCVFSRKREMTVCSVTTLQGENAVCWPSFVIKGCYFDTFQDDTFNFSIRKPAFHIEIANSGVEAL